ncbi:MULTISPECIES: 30S ribosomal protein S20 [Corynebacterium]|uniref:Small ribosomal subunit protein bS20 n=1 Tax=Corynebacterium gottingense TaxID=2041036 RepID=A0ABX9UKU8_9CORY|nr:MULTISPECIES: 30S ribosomal protein S20 [Corynebacterium]MCG7253871.1 30S ribosomal protein S20 [Corynebacterium hadale]MCG7256687.1 30S ribosomal protein S20 [Corynebacterium hadale]MCG7264582.1 30S ribosomal protein S20 [Corynebacterium hadale]PAT04093.1 30S ribosomal protein S20 [Corynebacterium sp. NML 150383]RMD20079.1 30S ribosomal protein S20 [Corynebacterium gottingense]
MANIKQQKKRVLTNEKRRLRNKSIRSATRTEIRKFREAVESGDKAVAEAQLRVASRKLDKAVTKGVYHRNSAANKKSNMATALNKMA